MSDAQAALGCDLGALSGKNRTRRSTLSSRLVAQVRKVQEMSDGYAAYFDPDPAVLRDAFDWLLLERRCCPFLRLKLCFEPSDGPVSLRFRGGPGVKEFLAATMFKAFLADIRA